MGVRAGPALELTETLASLALAILVPVLAQLVAMRGLFLGYRLLRRLLRPAARV